MEYKESIDQQRMKTLDELTAQAQELHLGYDVTIKSLCCHLLLFCKRDRTTKV